MQSREAGALKGLAEDHFHGADNLGVPVGRDDVYFLHFELVDPPCVCASVLDAVRHILP
jgi:hypothetical protein